MMPELTEILPMIQALPSSAKEELFAILAVELKKSPPTDEQELPGEEPFQYDPSNPSLGLFYDEPEVMEDVLRLAMEAREREYGEWRGPDGPLTVVEP